MLTNDDGFSWFSCAGKTKTGGKCKKAAHYRDYGTEKHFCWQHAPQYVKDFCDMNLAEVIAFHVLGPTRDMEKDMARVKEHMRRLEHADG